MSEKNAIVQKKPREVQTARLAASVEFFDLDDRRNCKGGAYPTKK